MTNRHRGRPRRNADAPAAIGQRIELTLQRLTHDGRGIGSWQGRTVFVEGGLPGEKVTARVVRARSKLIETRLETISHASPERQKPRCRHADVCGGCTLQHMPHDTQVTIKQQALVQQLQHFSGVQPEHWMPPLLGPGYGYRQRTRLSVRWNRKDRHLEVGYRKGASSELVDVEECPILTPVLEQLLKALPATLRDLEAKASLGHVELIGGEAPAMVVRHTDALSDSDLARLKSLAAEHEVQLWLQGGEGTAVLPATNKGSEALGYMLEDQGLRFDFLPGDFTQVNAQMNQLMVNQALSWLNVKPGQKVLDLFCGAGNFALPLAQAGAAVTGLEGSAAMVSQATANAEKNQLSTVHFFQADLSKALENYELKQDYQAALLDPPRDGAGNLVAALAERRIPRILYVSCNPATLARDAGILAARGYRLEQAGVMDMFPQTGHVEAMALFVSGEENNNGTSQS